MPLLPPWPSHQTIYLGADAILVGRFVVGAAVAVSAVSDVSYLAEVAPRGVRGAMVSANEMAISLGVLASFLAGHLLRHERGKCRRMAWHGMVLQGIGQTSSSLPTRAIYEYHVVLCRATDTAVD